MATKISSVSGPPGYFVPSRLRGLHTLPRPRTRQPNAGFGSGPRPLNSRLRRVSGGSSTKTGLKRTTLIYKLERFGICRPVASEAAL